MRHNALYTLKTLIRRSIPGHGREQCRSTRGLVCLAGLLALLASLAAIEQHVHDVKPGSVEILIGDHSTQLNTTSKDVDGVLLAAGISLGTHDRVTPSIESKVSNGSTIVVSRGHLLALRVDGRASQVWVNASSVGDAVTQLGYATDDYVSVPRGVLLSFGVTALSISTPKHLTVKVDGRLMQVVSAGPTVRAAIADTGVAISGEDLVSVPLGSEVVNGEVIAVRRVSYKIVVELRSIPFRVLIRHDPSMYLGQRRISVRGMTGQSSIRSRLRCVGGRLASKVALRTVVVRRPVTEVEQVGTRPTPPAFPAQASPSQAQQVATGMMSAHGWNGTQVDCLFNLWSKESGWRFDAANPSGAYGIPQALPADKMAAAGADWQTDARTQMTWGLGYIAAVYGDPCDAWAHEIADNWY